MIFDIPKAQAVNAHSIEPRNSPLFEFGNAAQNPCALREIVNPPAISEQR
jgi:hypothetical protein